MPLVIRPMVATDLPEAGRIARVAFGTFLGVPDIENFWTDLDYIAGRFGAPHVAGFTAEADGLVLGSNLSTRWGSVGFFGPLSLRPDWQKRGIAKSLVGAVTDQFDAWGVRHAGLFTFPHSPLHLALYGAFGYRARFLTAVMSIPPRPDAAVPEWFRFSDLAPGERQTILHDCGALSGAIYDGLDLTSEIIINRERQLGDTILVRDGDGRLASFAVCHWGPGTEAGTDTCLIKFGAARSGPDAGDRFDRLLGAVVAQADQLGMGRVLGGVNLGREDAYNRMVARGCRAVIQGVTMHRPNEPAYSRPDCFVIDDWR